MIPAAPGGVRVRPGLFGSHAYYDWLAARPDAAYAYPFRSQAELDTYPTEGKGGTRLPVVYDPEAEAALFRFTTNVNSEQKFIHLAVDEDKNLQVVTLVRTADNKYYRLVLDNAEQLAGGFPKKSALRHCLNNAWQWVISVPA